MTEYHRLSVDDTLAALNSQKGGLTETEAVRRIAEHGPNELVERGAQSPWRLLLEQLSATMVLILIAAAVVSALLGDYKDAIAIVAIVALYAALGFTQEYRAEKAMAALKQLAVPIVRARRDGQVLELDARQLVPGDVLLLEAGNRVPADARLLDSASLRVQESALTGESEPVEKHTDPLDRADLAVGDRRNMVYMGTSVTYGRGTAAIVATGMQTELGRIATLIQQAGRELTPLQRRLDGLGRMLAVAGVGIAALVFALGILRGEDARLMLMTGVSVAVALVPEGLPAVVTITLALGAQRMLKRQALIRKLPAVETLGSVTVICSDKTGTLTENRMTVTVLDVAGHRVDLVEPLQGTAPALSSSDAVPDALEAQPALALLAAAGALCNDAQLRDGNGGGKFHTIGDPTEGAMVVAGARLGMWKRELDAAFPRVAEVPFDSDRKRMLTVHALPQSAATLPVPLRSAWQLGACLAAAPYAAFAKGAVDSLLGISTHVWLGDRAEALDESWRARIVAAHDGLAQDGMRVLGVAFRALDAPPNGNLDLLERDLIFVGMVGMIDPPRPEVQAAVKTAQSAGIRPVMITGDHPLTARHIARVLGIDAGNRVLTGQDLARMSVEELERAVADVSVFARVSPEHKLAIVQALQKRGHIVAMTGDGVNDAPALKRADIGVAMGITGTDVSKEASEMVLRDDNFATIVAAIEEGRTIYDNLRKFIKFSLGGNVGKILVVLLAPPVLSMPLPLLPLQLLWLNLLTDGLLGLGLGVEPAERDVMRRSPVTPRAPVLGRREWLDIAWTGLLIGLAALGLGFVYWQMGRPEWQTLAFSTLAFAQIGQAFAARSSRDSLFRIGLRTNPTLLVMALLTLALQFAAVYAPFLQDLLGTVALAPVDLLAALGLSILVFAAIEVAKKV